MSKTKSVAQKLCHYCMVCQRALTIMIVKHSEHFNMYMFKK